MKKFLSIVLVLLCASMIFGNNNDYEYHLELAEEYEENGQYIYALGEYLTAIEADPTEKAIPAYNKFIKLKEVIENGNPGFGKFDIFSMYEGWKKITAEFEEYWMNNSIMYVCIPDRKPVQKEVNFKNKTGIYTVPKFSMTESSIYKLMKGIVLKGYQKSYRKDWDDMKSGWLTTDFFNPDFGKMTDINNYSVSYILVDKTGANYLESSILLSKVNKNLNIQGIPSSKFEILDKGLVDYKVKGLKCTGTNGKEISINHFTLSDTNPVIKMEFLLIGEPEMVEIPGMDIVMLKTEVTQDLYEKVMGENPSYYVDKKYPVFDVSWYDAIYFCNKLSEFSGRTPVYAVNGSTDTAKWNYTPHKNNGLLDPTSRDYDSSKITMNSNANGYRLPTEYEWLYAAKEGNLNKKNIPNNLNSISWNENNTTSLKYVATKAANSFGLYDLYGNVWEWVWDSAGGGEKHTSSYLYGGSYKRLSIYWEGISRYDYSTTRGDIGIRLVRKSEPKLEPKIEVEKNDNDKKLNMVKIPGLKLSMLTTEVTQELYEEVMGENPSHFTGNSKLPVEGLDYFDAVKFCNKLSILHGKTPVYSIDDETDVDSWNYDFIYMYENLSQNLNANGYRLPTKEEWVYAAKGGKYFTYSGSNDINSVAWYFLNSGDKTHPVAQKKANNYGLYDMSGNVSEMCWISENLDDEEYICGGSWNDFEEECTVSSCSEDYSDLFNGIQGFRIVTISE